MTVGFLNIARGCASLCWYDLPEAKVREAAASALQLVNIQDFMCRATHALRGAAAARGGCG